MLKTFATSHLERRFKNGVSVSSRLSTIISKATSPQKNDYFRWAEFDKLRPSRHFYALDPFQRFLWSIFYSSRSNRISSLLRQWRHMREWGLPLYAPAQQPSWASGHFDRIKSLRTGEEGPDLRQVCMKKIAKFTWRLASPSGEAGSSVCWVARGGRVARGCGPTWVLAPLFLSIA